MSYAVTDFEKAYVRPRTGRALVVGSHVYAGREDRRKRYAEAEGWDAIDGEGVDRVIDLEDENEMEQAASVLFYHVDCISVLEHSKRPWLVARNLERLMVADATLFITVPFIWRVHAYPFDYWRFTIDGLRLLFTCIDWKELRYAHVSLGDEYEKIAAKKIDGYPYFARTEVCGFGVKA